MFGLVDFCSGKRKNVCGRNVRAEREKKAKFTTAQVSRPFPWPILRTGPADDRARRPFQCDRSRSLPFAPERLHSHSFQG